MKHWSLKNKLMGWSAIMVVSFCLVSALATAIFLKHEQTETLDGVLRQEARVFTHQFDRHKTDFDWQNLRDVKALLLMPYKQRYVDVTDQEGNVLHLSPNLQPNSFRQLASGQHAVTVGGKNVRVIVLSHKDFTLKLGASLNEIEGDTKEVWGVFLTAAPLLISLALFGSWWLARIALKPIKELATASEQINAEQLHQRLPEPKMRDEIGRLAQVLNALFKRLDHSFKQARRFSEDASHELKTPLTILRSGMEDLWESPTLNSSDKEKLTSLLEQVQQLSAIIESLVLLSQFDAGRQKLDLVCMDITETILTCLDDSQIMAETHHIEVTHEIPATLEAMVDTGRLTQILLNLLSNAIKYNRENGKVQLKAWATPKNQVIITIANTGVSIASDDAFQIFERFFRAEHSAATQGQGLGLSIARELARAHGGDIVLEQSDETWTVFRLTLLGNQVKHV